MSTKLRRLRNPDRYLSPKDAAKWLRRIAKEYEGHDQWVAISLHSSFASKEEVESSLAKSSRRVENGG